MHTVGVDVAALAAEADVRAAAGQTPMYVAVDGTLSGLVAVADTVKDTSAEAVAQLEALGLEVWMLTGDNAATAAAIASSVGIDRVVADVLPAEKAAHVQRLQDQGHVVGFVGDGINDAPALATADLGIAIGTGTDVAIAASDITLVGGDLRGITAAIALSRRTVRTIKQGLGWAFSYNILLIPVAAGALYWWDRLLLDPVLASAAMAMSSVSVVSNALRLRRFERPETAAAILQPKLSARIGDYAFLATVAAHRPHPRHGLHLGQPHRNGQPRHERPARLDRRHGHADAPRHVGDGDDRHPADLRRTTPDSASPSRRSATSRLGVRRPCGSRSATRTGTRSPDLVRTHQVWSHLS